MTMSRIPAGPSVAWQVRTRDSISPNLISRPARCREPWIIFTFLMRPKSSADMRSRLKAASAAARIADKVVLTLE